MYGILVSNRLTITGVPLRVNTYKGFRDTIYLTPPVRFWYTRGMINDNKTYTVNLTHIATSYPHSFDISDDTYKKLYKAKSTDYAIDTLLINHLGMGWYKDYFFDSISKIKF